MHSLTGGATYSLSLELHLFFGLQCNSQNASVPLLGYNFFFLFYMVAGHLNNEVSLTSQILNHRNFLKVMISFSGHRYLNNVSSSNYSRNPCHCQKNG